MVLQCDKLPLETGRVARGKKHGQTGEGRRSINDDNTGPDASALSCPVAHKADSLQYVYRLVLPNAPATEPYRVHSHGRGWDHRLDLPEETGMYPRRMRLSTPHRLEVPN